MSINLNSHSVESVTASNDDFKLDTPGRSLSITQPPPGIEGLDELAVSLNVSGYTGGEGITLEGKSGKLYSLVGILFAHIALLKSPGHTLLVLPTYQIHALLRELENSMSITNRDSGPAKRLYKLIADQLGVNMDVSGEK